MNVGSPPSPYRTSGYFDIHPHPGLTSYTEPTDDIRAFIRRPQVIFCFLLMAGLPIVTSFRFLIWLVIYFLYSRHRSEFAKQR